MLHPSPIDTFLARQPFAVLDGGLATELERRGLDLFDPLWSAKAVIEHPSMVRAVHLDFLRAGADVVTTASYQATVPGLQARGLSTAEASAVIATSVALAREARQEFLAAASLGGRLSPLVAGSVGPYGAYLHDGSEYRGDYTLTDREFKAFHRPRFEVLVEAGVDLIACETMPSRREVAALVDLLEERGTTPAWVSFTARDDEAISDGSRFADCVAELAGAKSVVAVGVNCTPVERIAPLLERAGPSARQPFVVYPNAGGTFEATTGQWIGDPHAESILAQVSRWRDLGARIIGGCCRTGPATIAGIRAKL
jgi:homocysteine S-methyltransferase